MKCVYLNIKRPPIKIRLDPYMYQPPCVRLCFTKTDTQFKGDIVSPDVYYTARTHP